MPNSVGKGFDTEFGIHYRFESCVPLKSFLLIKSRDQTDSVMYANCKIVVLAMFFILPTPQDFLFEAEWKIVLKLLVIQHFRFTMNFTHLLQ